LLFAEGVHGAGGAGEKEDTQNKKGKDENSETAAKEFCGQSEFFHEMLASFYPILQTHVMGEQTSSLLDHLCPSYAPFPANGELQPPHRKARSMPGVVNCSN
jgi:hypothetical protein